MVQVGVEPLVQRIRLIAESIGEGIPIDGSTHKHHSTRKESGEAHPHLVQDDTCKNEEEDKHIEERFGPLHGTECK